MNRICGNYHVKLSVASQAYAILKQINREMRENKKLMGMKNSHQKMKEKNF